jgi:hypothetical protein
MAMLGAFWRFFRRTGPQNGADSAPAPAAQPAAVPQPAAGPIPTMTPAAPSASSGGPPLPKNPWEEVERALVRTIPAILVITLILTVGLLVTQRLHGLVRADEKMLILGVSVLFASVALVFLTRLIRSLEDGELLGIESHWGGLGGGVGGWRISMPVAYFIGVATFAALAAVAVSHYSTPDVATTSTTSATSTTGTTSTSGTTSTTPATRTTGPAGTTSTSATNTQGTSGATSTKAP